jgi:hypothetical protein
VACTARRRRSRSEGGTGAAPVAILAGPACAMALIVVAVVARKKFLPAQTIE